MLADLQLLSPHSGLPLLPYSLWSLTDGERLYPVIDDIPYLRTGRESLCESVVALLDQGQSRQALCLLLQDQDDWAHSAKPSCDAMQELIEGRLSLREAMQALNFGAVGDYFAYRWSDPTFLSGLALLEAHLAPGVIVLELACGIGHYLREFELRAIPAIGFDVVFAKLWLARHYLAPSTPLVCCDAHSRLPLPEGSVNAVFCHDAFYFLRDKQHVVSEMRRVAGNTGAILIGHTHCAEVENFSSGEPLRIEEYTALLPGPTLYDDAELTESVLENRKPVPGVGSNAAAIALAIGSGNGHYDFTVPPKGTALRLNPLLASGRHEPSWPSQRYEEEYAALSGYLRAEHIPEPPDEASIRRRLYVSLPDRW